MARNNNTRNRTGNLANRNRNFIVAGILALVAAVFLISGTGSQGAVSVWQGSAELADNTLSDTQRGEQFVDLQASFDELTNESKGSYNVTTNADGSLSIDCTLDCSEDVSATQSDIEDIIPYNPDTDTLTRVWYNENYDVGGFNQDFEAYLVKVGTNYEVYYQIGTEKFVVEDLQKVNTADNDLSSWNTGVNFANFVATFNYIESQGGEIYMSNQGSNDLTRESTSSLVYVVNDKLHIVKRQYGTGGTNFGNGQTEVHETISSDNVDDTFNRPRGSWVAGQTVKELQYFAVDRLSTYSFDSVSVYSDSTRTTGFDIVTMVKQELDQGDSSFTNKYFKLLTQEDFDQIVTQGNAQLTPFLENRIDGNLELEVSYPIDVSGETYDLGTDIQGITISDGYVSQDDVQGGDVIHVSQIDFQESTSKGLTFQDLGESDIRAEGLDVVSFGNLYNGMNITTQGTAYLIDPTGWDRATGVLWNLLTFDFSGVSQFWSNEVTNPSISDLIGTGSDRTYAFSSAKSTPHEDDLELTSAKPLNDLLTFNGQNYWLFYTLETSNNGEGCIVFDMLNTNLNQRIPVAICEDIVAGSNSASQFKINSGEDSN